MNTKQNFSLGIISILALLSSQPAFAAVQTVQAYGSDTVAGYETIIKSEKVLPWQEVTFTVTKPDGTAVTLNANSGNDGMAKINLSDYHTRKAGRYNVQAFLGTTAGTDPGVSHSFQVFADKVSPEQSQALIDKTVVQPGNNDFSTLNVKLTDSYGNPVENHLVQVFSSRSFDKVVNFSSTGLTDVHGNAYFHVSSPTKGISEYTMFDATSGTMLTQHLSVAYVESAQFMADVGGEFPFFIDTAKAAAGTLHHFDISGLPDSILPNQNVSFTVTAQDDTNQTVQAYTGKVHFSTEGSGGSNVALPEDYTFKAEDLGIHQFSLGLSFKAAGSYKIVVTDLSNTLIKGTKDVTVGGGGTTQQPGNANITLDSPIAGTYSQKVQTVTGKAQSGLTVKIYDNQQEIGSIQAASDGKYTFQTSPLSDGPHSVYAVMYDNTQTAKGTSSTVLFSIDTTPPKVDEITLNPTQGIQPGTPINVKVVSEENLSQAAVVFNGDIIQLNPSLENAGTYVGTVQAPSTPGVYPIDVLLVDQLSNEGSYKGKAQVTVSNEGGSIVTQQSTEQTTQQIPDQTQQDVIPPVAPTNTPPSKVSGVLTYAGNKKITLVWNAATDTETFVKHYRIYYGNDARNLDSFVDTKDAGTTWYVPNLENGKEYYFAISAFDSDGMEGTVLSEVVSGIPFSTEVGKLGQVAGPISSNTHPSAGGYASAPTTPQNGPELFVILLGSGTLAGVVRKFRRKIKK